MLFNEHFWLANFTLSFEMYDILTQWHVLDILVLFCSVFLLATWSAQLSTPTSSNIENWWEKKDKWRHMWRHMTSTVQKILVDSGCHRICEDTTRENQSDCYITMAYRSWRGNGRCLNIKIVQTTQNSRNFVVGKSRLLKKWHTRLVIIREISFSNLMTGRVDSTAWSVTQRIYKE